MHILEADSIQLSFDNRVILSDIYIKCETGKITGLLGRNGQGKSCLMKIIYGDLTCDKSIRFDGISESKAFSRPDLLLYLPQFNFIPSRLSLKRIFSDFEVSYLLFTEFFPEFTTRKTERIGNLSGGERRLIELYIILKAATKFAMLDEPFTHLNPLQVEKVKALLTEEKKTKGFLIIDHMFKHITGISDSLYILKDGKTHPTRSESDIEALGYARL